MGEVFLGVTGPPVHRFVDLLDAPGVRRGVVRQGEFLSAADALALDLSQVSVKATTEEKLGFTGAEEGIAAHSVVLLVQSPAPKAKVMPL